MPRNISFAMTTDQIRAKTKTVTRRFGWIGLMPGTILQPVEKAMGLRRGEKATRIGGPIRVVSVRREPLNAIDTPDCIREGFPHQKPRGFVAMMVDHYGCKPTSMVTRIEFEYL